MSLTITHTFYSESEVELPEGWVYWDAAKRAEWSADKANEIYGELVDNKFDSLDCDGGKVTLGNHDIEILSW